MHTDNSLHTILSSVQDGTIDVNQGMDLLRDLPYQDMGHTKLDLHRSLRNGFPEVIYGAGKTPEQVADIFEAVQGRTSGKGNLLATRVSEEMASVVRSRVPEVQHNSLARTLTLVGSSISYGKGKVGIITAGTSDLDVAEEAKVTCEMLGQHAEVISDVGVAGIHRLFDRLDQLRSYSVLIVIAGMEGALSSVVGGLVDQPIIAVPTSVGYGASFSGLSALLGMLTSCASGVTVVNIDNGFGAACAACKVMRLVQREAERLEAGQQGNDSSTATEVR